MNDNIFFYDDEDDDYEGLSATYNIRYQNSEIAQTYLFTFEYRFPRQYYEFLEDIDLNGMVVGNAVVVSKKYVVDALRSGILKPALIKSSNEDLHVYCQYWSPLQHMYMDFEDMSNIELEWLQIGLVSRIWSYN